MAFDYDLSEVRELIRENLPEVRGPQKTVISAMTEAVENGGKRVRPIIIFETCRMFTEAEGVSFEKLRPTVGRFMAAMEMIHTFSLIHDDLPCMDNDTLRRGKPTTWYKYGEAMGVLAGDGLALEALYLAGLAAAEAPEPARAAQAVRVLGEKSGIRGMLGGQSVDVELTGKKLDSEQLSFIDRLKTGALIEASFMIGALLGGADPEQVRIAEKIGTDVGTAFQIRDDILDVTSTAEVMGKSVHTDEKNEKSSTVDLFGLEGAEKEVERLTENALRYLDRLPGDGSVLRELIRYLAGRKH